MLGLCFSVPFSPSLATGSRPCAAASPCGWTWTLFLQLKDQLKRIHTACLYQQFNKVEIITSLQSASSLSSKTIVMNVETLKKCTSLFPRIPHQIMCWRFYVNAEYNLMYTKFLKVRLLLLYRSVSFLSHTGCSLNQHLTDALLQEQAQRLFITIITN